jgi:metal-dependent amidase/aminoacylase/carboxypeptidase family protein
VIETVGVVIGGIVALFGLIATAAVIVVRWRTSSDETTAKLWKEEAEAWKAKAERLEVMYSSLDKRVEHLEQENKMLRQLHDNRRDIAEVKEIALRIEAKI